VTSARLKADGRFGRYDNSVRNRRGFSSAVYKEGAAYLHALRDRSATAEQTIVYITIILNQERNR
jgi:hypothetical protein